MRWTLSLAFALPDVDEAMRTGATAPNDAAVLIGIEDCFMLPKVPHADADARAVRGFLRYPRGVPDARVRMLGKGANREQLLKVLDTLAPTGGTDGTLWVYVAGHGAADPESGERVLVGADTQADQATIPPRPTGLPSTRHPATGASPPAPPPSRHSTAPHGPRPSQRRRWSCSQGRPLSVASPWRSSPCC